MKIHLKEFESMPQIRIINKLADEYHLFSKGHREVFDPKYIFETPSQNFYKTKDTYDLHSRYFRPIFDVKYHLELP